MRPPSCRVSGPASARRSTRFPYTTLFRSHDVDVPVRVEDQVEGAVAVQIGDPELRHHARRGIGDGCGEGADLNGDGARSEEHTSELQSRGHLVCRLLLDKQTRLVSSKWSD